MYRYLILMYYVYRNIWDSCVMSYNLCYVENNKFKWKYVVTYHRPQYYNILLFWVSESISFFNNIYGKLKYVMLDNGNIVSTYATIHKSWILKKINTFGLYSVQEQTRGIFLERGLTNFPSHKNEQLTQIFNNNFSL